MASFPRPNHPPNRADACEGSPPATAGRRKEARPRNAEQTRATILRAARIRFAEDGFEAATLKNIATIAEVDPALICRYFSNKEELFRAVLTAAAEDNSLFCGSPAIFSDKISGLLVTGPTQSHELDELLIVLKSANTPGAAAIIRDVIRGHIFDAITAWLECDRAAVRARLITALIFGLGVTRAITTDFDLPATEIAELRRQAQRAIQSWIESDEI